MTTRSCKDCIHHRKLAESIAYPDGIGCQLLNTIYYKSGHAAESCKYFNVEVKGLPICYNCKHFLGGGDWGLACDDDYYKLPTATTKACEHFAEREKQKSSKKSTKKGNR